MKIRTGIIGCGNISAVHIDAIKLIENAELISVCDNNKNKSENFGCNKYTDYRQMLLNEKLDVVHICTPHYLHKEMAVFALEQGCNVILEKPAAISVKEVNEIINARDKSGKLVQLVYQNRLNPASQKIKSIIDSKKYGGLKGIKAIVAWYRNPEYYLNSGWRGKFETEGGGVLINQSIHTLDLMSYFSGKAVNVKASLDNFSLSDVVEVEDTASAYIEYESGVRGVFYATVSNLCDSPVEMEFIFDNAIAVIKGTQLTINHNNAVEVFEEEKFEGDKAYWGNSHVRLIRDFYDNLQSDKLPCSPSLEDGLESLRIIEEMYKKSGFKEII